MECDVDENAESDDQNAESDDQNEDNEFNEDNEDDYGDEEDHDDDNTELFSLNLKCRGCTFGENQVVLSTCRKLGRDMGKLEVRLSFEHDNPVDKNAIAFQVKLNDEWKRIGYVGVAHIPRVREAIEENKIDGISLSSILLKSLPSGKTYYTCFCNILKIGKWSRLSTTNAYNK